MTKIEWDARLRSRPMKYVGYFVWLMGCMCFAAGVYARFPADSYLLESGLVAAILFAETYSLLNFRKMPSIRHLAIIALIAYWGAGFFLHRINMIDDSGYALVVGSFLLLTVFVRSR